MPRSTPGRDLRRTRRRWLQAAGTLIAGSAVARPGRAEDVPAAPAAPPPIGLLLGTIGRPTLEARFDAVRACGLSCVQLNLGCCGLPAMPDAIPPDLAGRVRREADARGIRIVSLEGTFNMSHPDAAHRRDGLARLRAMAAFGRELGTTYIHLCTGTRDRGSMWRRHPDNDTPDAWRDLAACMREAADIARQADRVLAFEPEVNNVVDSAKKARRLLDETGSPHLKVTIDGANLFHAGELPRMGEILDEAFALIGKDIALAHAKDLDHDGDAGHLPAGHGQLDYGRYLSLLLAQGYTGPLLLHGLSEAQVPGCVTFLRDTLARVAAKTK